MARTAGTHGGPLSTNGDIMNEPSDLDRLRLIAELLRAMTEDLTSVVDRLDERDERRAIELTETWA